MDVLEAIDQLPPELKHIIYRHYITLRIKRINKHHLRFQILKRQLHRLFLSECLYIVYVLWEVREGLEDYPIYRTNIRQTMTALEDMGATEDELTMYRLHFEETINTSLEFKEQIYRVWDDYNVWDEPARRILYELEKHYIQQRWKYLLSTAAFNHVRALTI